MRYRRTLDRSRVAASGLSRHTRHQRQDGHPDRDAIACLFEDERARAKRHLARDFDTFVDRTRMKE